MHSEQKHQHLNRALGIKETLSIVVNRIIGSGIFRTPASIMLITGSLSIFYGVWVIGGIATILAALCYAELVAMMPKSGGPYVFLKEAYPPYVTFLRGWAMFFVSETGAIAAVSLFFSETVLNILHLQNVASLQMFIAMLLVIVLTAINSFGVKLSGQLQNVFGFLKIAVLVLVVVFGFSKGINTGNFAESNGDSLFSMAGIITVFTAMRYGFFAYSGWEGATYVAEEVKNPEKNLPLSLFAGIGIVILLYLLINTAYINMLGAEGISKAKVVASDAMTASIGFAGAVFISIAIMISTLGNVNTQVMVKSRTWYAMARDSLFFKPLAVLNPKYNTPNVSLYVQALWAIVLIAFASMASSAYEAVIDFFSFTSSIFNVLTFVSVIVLRKKYPDLYRPYKTWGYPFTIIIVLIIQFAFMLVTLYTAFIPSLIGILLTSTGLLYYKYYVPEEVKKA